MSKVCWKRLDCRLKYLVNIFFLKSQFLVGINSQYYYSFYVDPLEMDFQVLRQPLHFMKDKSAAPKWLTEANEEIAAADGFVVVLSEYNCGIPPALGNMMDHFPPSSYRHRPCSIITYSMGKMKQFPI
jgi:hypothetical protein